MPVYPREKVLLHEYKNENYAIFECFVYDNFCELLPFL